MDSEPAFCIWVGTRWFGARCVFVVCAALPPGGISEHMAIQVAREHVTGDAALVSATGGRFGDVYHDSRIGLGYPIEGDRLVWAVTFAHEFVICAPDDSPCWSPRPGQTTVVLDYFTGDFLAAPGNAPP
jgi:hypothetical protein